MARSSARAPRHSRGSCGIERAREKRRLPAGSRKGTAAAGERIGFPLCAPCGLRRASSRPAKCGAPFPASSSLGWRQTCRSTDFERIPRSTHALRTESRNHVQATWSRSPTSTHARSSSRSGRACNRSGQQGAAIHPPLQTASGLCVAGSRSSRFRESQRRPRFSRCTAVRAALQPSKRDSGVHRR